ncbi:hypothetical protein [Streptomyces sp. NRRL S-31]|uniref:hypothetical protein n=1 Tax=Streptomyces sp. NRRL S-31 TaxID=1463898 RepID=UPI0004C5E3F4|nr:hypothetical protein [Streptomyces sp. NRRL S-31]
MDRSLVSVRAALVLSLAALAGVGAGVLAVPAGDGTAGGVLAGLTTAGGAVPVFDRMIAQDSAHHGNAAHEADMKGGNARG